MNYSKKNFIFHISIIFSPFLQGFDKAITLSQASAILRRSSSFPQKPHVSLPPSEACAVLQSGIEAIEKAPYALDKYPLEESQSASRSPNTLTFDMRNDQAYCTLYIPFKKTPPTIEMGEMGFKTSSAPQKPSEHVFFSKSFLVLRKSKGGFCEYMAPLSTFNYKCVDKKSYKFISSSEEGDKYKISDSEKESLIKELTAIKKTIEESLKKFEPADEKTISPIFNQ